jgi:hypothetical protein
MSPHRRRRLFPLEDDPAYQRVRDELEARERARIEAELARIASESPEPKEEPAAGPTPSK